MREIALHILDIAENGIRAGADRIAIVVDEARQDNRLRIEISDNGSGIPPEILAKVSDPFVSTRKTRRVGLGLSLLEAAARRCGGEFHIQSSQGQGTKVTAAFQYDHIDRAPMGDMSSTIVALLVGNPKVDFFYSHTIDGRQFAIDTQEIKKEIEGVSISDPAVIQYLNRTVREALDQLARGGESSKR